MGTVVLEKIEKPVNDTISRANSIMVIDTASRLAASEYLKVVKGMQKKVSDTFDPIVAKAKETHTEACNQRAKYLDPLKLAEAQLKNKAITYDEELARKEREEQAKLEAKARAEEERKRKELEERARKAAEKGNEAKAEELRQKAAEVQVAAPVVQTQAVKVAGQATVTLHDAEITDKMALIKYLANNPNFQGLLMPDTKALKQLATATKGTMTIPGVRFFTTKTMSARG